MTGLDQAARERITERMRAQAAAMPPPSREYLEELAALIAAIRVRRARDAAARAGSNGHADP